MATHAYPVQVSWTGGREGSGEVTAEQSGARNALAVPAEFGGPGGATNPEELLTQSIAACYTMTFGIIAANRKLPIEGISVSAVGEVEQQGATFTYQKVTIHPTITLSGEATEEQVTMAEDMAHKADSYCIITNAVRGKVQVVVEPEIRRS